MNKAEKIRKKLIQTLFRSEKLSYGTTMSRVRHLSRPKRANSYMEDVNNGFIAEQFIRDQITYLADKGIIKLIEEKATLFCVFNYKY